MFATALPSESCLMRFRPTRRAIRGKKFPNFLRVTLEESFEQALAKAVGNPIFERFLGTTRKGSPEQIAPDILNPSMIPKPASAFIGLSG